MATIIDLDDILGDPKHVKLAGTTYELPPDLPVELYLKINHYQDAEKRGVSELQLIEELYDDVLSLFRYRQPDLQSLPLTLSQLMLAISHVYGSAEAEPAATPPRAARAGTRSTPRTRSKTRSRS